MSLNNVIVLLLKLLLFLSIIVKSIGGNEGLVEDDETPDEHLLIQVSPSLPPLRRGSREKAETSPYDEFANTPRVSSKQKPLQIKLIRKSDDAYEYAEDDSEEELNTRILESYHGDKQAKVVHVTRSVAEEQPNIFVYLPSPIKHKEVGKRFIETVSPSVGELDDYSKKTHVYDDELDQKHDQKVITQTRTAYTLPTPSSLVTEQRVYATNKKTFASSVPVTTKFVRIQPVHTKVIESTPVLKTSFIKTTKFVVPSQPQSSQVTLIRSVPVIKPKAIIITPPIPQRTTTVYTTHYSPATRTVVYEAEHIPLRTTVPIFRFPSYSITAPSQNSGYQSEWIPLTTKTRSIKSALKEKLFKSPALSYIRRNDDHEVEATLDKDSSLKQY